MDLENETEKAREELRKASYLEQVVEKTGWIRKT